jgi:DNA-binding NtrC family response regulator
MPESLLAIVSPATEAELLQPPLDLPLQVVPSSGAALEWIESQPECRLVLVEREVEPQLGRLVQRLRRAVPSIEILLLAAAMAPLPRRELQLLGVDWLDRGQPPPDLRRELRHRFRRASLQARAGLVGRDPRLVEILETVLQVGPTDIPVLVTGPSGAGKELVARALYLASRRAERPFVALNVGALAESVLESELFGHEKGAFTGAVARKEGVFERADGGTLFLDEVGEMSLHTQVRLLRALDSGEITPVGATRTLGVDVRLVAATNRPLEAAVRAGVFREDLYYRLRVVQIEVPPLAARRDDIVLLAEHFLAESRRLYETRALHFTDAARRLLVAHEWPGNVRELRNVVHGAAVLAKGELLDAADLPEALRRGDATPNVPVPLARPPEQAERDVVLGMLWALRRDMDEVLSTLRAQPAHRRPVVVEPEAAVVEPEPTSWRDAERDLIRNALAQTGGNRRMAAERLGMAERTFYRKLKAYGLE